MAGKRDFGSFHSSNTRELIVIPDDKYVPPPFPIELPSFKQYETKPFEFGRPAREKHFNLEQECTFINHGAFGAVLKQALEVAQAWQLYTERQPLRFLDRELIPHLVFVTRRLAMFVGCDAQDLVLVSNATTGTNCVLRSHKFNKGDVIFCLSVVYGAVKKALNQICLETGATLQEEEIPLPIENKQQILDIVSASLRPGTKLAVFDHIPSNTPFIMPIKELIDLCHSRDVPVLVDGAHALGGVPLNLSDLDPDYYVGNAHKWFSAPKGCAYMYVSREHQPNTRPLIISHGFGSGFNAEFIWSGLRDYSPFLSLHTVLDFWQAVGPDTLREYMHSLSKKAGELLTEKWKSCLLAPQEMFGCMCAVRLPEALYGSCQEVNYDKAEIVQNHLYHSFDIEVPIKAINGHLYARTSAHIYNQIEDYERLAEAVLQLANEDIFKTDIEN